MKRTDKQVEQEVISLYQQGLSMEKVGNKYNISPATVMRILDRNNIERRTHGGIYKLPTDKIVNMYRNGLSCQQIADEYKVSFHSISNLLENSGVSRDNRYKNTELDTTYFHSIDRYDKAYFLGLIISDGNITDNLVKISLHPRDIEILNVFKKKTQNSNNIYHRKSKLEASIGAKCQQWKIDLAQYGVVPNKSHISYVPIIEEEYMSHLLRGLLDGDGWISASSHNIGFCGGNQTIVRQFRDALLLRLDIYPVNITHTKRGIYQVQWASHKDIVTICQYLYQNKQDCFLQRKYDKYLDIYGNTEVTNQIA